MSELNSVLRAVLEYYQKVGMGHTQVMLTGVSNSDRHPFVVVPSLHIAQNIGLPKTCRPLILKELTEKLAGASGPLAWEHTALQQVFRATHSRIRELEADVEDLKSQLVIDTLRRSE